jgi:hypothetical protein
MTDLTQVATDLSENMAIAAWKGLFATTGLPLEEAVTMRYRDWARVLGLYLPVDPPAVPLYFGKDYSKLPVQLVVHYRSSDRVAVALREECLAANEPIQFVVNDAHTINWLRLAEDDGKANFWAQLHLRMRPVTIWPVSSHLHVKIVPASAFDANLKSLIDGDNEALHSMYREGEAESNLKLKCTQSNLNYFLSGETKSTSFRDDLKALFLSEAKQQVISGVTSVCEQLLDELNDFRERMPTTKKDGLAKDECEAFLLVFMHSKIASSDSASAALGSGSTLSAQIPEQKSISESKNKKRKATSELKKDTPSAAALASKAPASASKSAKSPTSASVSAAASTPISASSSASEAASAPISGCESPIGFVSVYIYKNNIAMFGITHFLPLALARALHEKKDVMSLPKLNDLALPIVNRIGIIFGCRSIVVQPLPEQRKLLRTHYGFEGSCKSEIDYYESVVGTPCHRASGKAGSLYKYVGDHPRKILILKMTESKTPNAYDCIAALDPSFFDMPESSFSAVQKQLITDARTKRLNELLIKKNTVEAAAYAYTLDALKIIFKSKMVVVNKIEFSYAPVRFGFNPTDREFSIICGLNP